MTAPLRHQGIRLDPLEVFELRCWARAYLWSVCEFGLAEAVDELRHATVKNGLVDELGQDALQKILATAFHREAYR